MSRILSCDVVSVFLVSTFLSCPLSYPLKAPLFLLTCVCPIVPGSSKLSYLLFSSLLSSLLLLTFLAPLLSFTLLYIPLPSSPSPLLYHLSYYPIYSYLPLLSNSLYVSYLLFFSIVFPYLLSSSIMNFVFFLSCTRLHSTVPLMFVPSPNPCSPLSPLTRRPPLLHPLLSYSILVFFLLLSSIPCLLFACMLFYS